MLQQTHSDNEMWRVLSLAGGFTAVFSLVIGILLVFVVPGACSFVGAIQLLIIGFLFIAGIATFLIGKVLSR